MKNRWIILVLILFLSYCKNNDNKNKSGIQYRKDIRNLVTNYIYKDRITKIVIVDSNSTINSLLHNSYFVQVYLKTQSETSDYIYDPFMKIKVDSKIDFINYLIYCTDSLSEKIKIPIYNNKKLVHIVSRNYIPISNWPQIAFN